MLSLDQICAVSEDLRLRFATLVHDLGKGTTDKRLWPSHNGHEERGVKQIELLSRRLRIPNDCRDLAVKVSRWHLHCHRALELKAGTIEKLFSGLDLWRNPSLLEDVLLCCRADVRGRTGLENHEYPQADFLLGCFKAAAVLDSLAIREAGYQGVEIGQQMQKSRIAAIRKVKVARSKAI
jgi:tRNA nucleotidyltransferase (CCA-adding enzyme)